MPRWANDILRANAQHPELPPAPASAYRELELAYSSVCRLDIIMGDDAILNRMTLIRLHVVYLKFFQAI